MAPSPSRSPSRAGVAGLFLQAPPLGRRGPFSGSLFEAGLFHPLRLQGRPTLCREAGLVFLSVEAEVGCRRGRFFPAPMRATASSQKKIIREINMRLSKCWLFALSFVLLGSLVWSQNSGPSAPPASAASAGVSSTLDSNSEIT